MTQQQSHKKFLQRQQVYEKRYRRQVYRYLAHIYAVTARKVERGETSPEIKTDGIENLLKKLYLYVSINEAKLQWLELNLPKDRLKQKDIINDLLGIVSNTSDDLINVWRGLLNEFILVRIGTRIQEINDTTVRNINKIIEEGVNEGWGASKTATAIRKQTGYNRNRSLAIARTETVTAANQGKFMAAKSSPYQMEKNWIPTIDDRTRLSHRDMAGREFIDLDAPFWLANADGVLEEAQYPGDDSLSASNVINCRCSVTFRVKRDENGNILRK